jgi:2-dehydro-3-deoxyglucarate aldolase
MAHPAIPEIMAKAGFDWLTIDLEHSVITIREAEELIRVINLCNVSPLVRTTSNDMQQIKRVMDAGAKGVIVPMVNSEMDARKIVDAIYYPPKGKRGVGLARAQGYGAGFKEYKAWLEEHPVIIVQIEHIDAVNNLEKIFQVEGIDGYIIGPYDLSTSMGIGGQFDHPDFKKAIQKTHETATRLNIPGGIHVIEPNKKELQDKIAEGFKFIAYSLDIRMLDTMCRDMFAEIKK